MIQVPDKKVEKEVCKRWARMQVTWLLRCKQLDLCRLSTHTLVVRTSSQRYRDPVQSSWTFPTCRSNGNLGQTLPSLISYQIYVHPCCTDAGSCQRLFVNSQPCNDICSDFQASATCAWFLTKISEVLLPLTQGLTRRRPYKKKGRATRLGRGSVAG